MIDFRKIRLVKKAERFLRSVYLWDTTISLYVVLGILWKKIITLDLDQRAAAVSFSLLLAIFPSIIFFFTLIPYIPIENLDDQIMEFLRNILPRGIYSAAANTMEEIVSRRRVDILSFGFLFALYAATNGMMALMRAFNIVLDDKEKRGFFKARFIAIYLTFLLILVLIAAVVILIAGKLIMGYLLDRGLFTENVTYYFVQALRYISVFMIFFMGISSIYYFAPALGKKLSFFNVGSFFSSVLCILATNGFSFYLSNFDSYNKLYGSIGTLIGVMVWIYLIALIIILGFEVSTSVRDALELEHKMDEINDSSDGDKMEDKRV